MQPVLEIRNLTFSYPGREILKSINWQVYPGDFAALIGANGAGKSTLVKVALGLLPKNAGEVLLFRQPLHRFKDWQKVGYLSQNNEGLNSGFPATVEEVVIARLCARVGLFRRFGTGERQAVADALDAVGLAAKAQQLVGNLSGGEKQRMLIARMLVSFPQLIILDEPIAGLDEENTRLLLDILSRLNTERHAAIIIITHHLAMVAERATQVFSLSGGRLRQHDIRKIDVDGAAKSQPGVM